MKQIASLVVGFALTPLISQAASIENLQIDGKSISIKTPDQAAAGKPWLWVGEFGGHLKTLEDGLVEKGWHVVYAKLSNQFGSPKAMEVWEKLYAELREKRGFSPKPALVGISRGGLYVNAWTRLHPDKVSVLYLDNGVCDPRSWPGGFQLLKKGSSSPQSKDWGLFKNVFGFQEDEEAFAKAIKPTENMGPAVKAGVFLISVHGTADRTVPFEDNAAHLVEFWKQSGGRVKVFAKEGGDHHPHGLPDPTPLIELLSTEAVGK